MDRCALFVDANYVLAEGALAVHGTRNRDSVSWDYAGLLKLLGSLSRDRTGLPLLRGYWYDTAADGARAAEHEALADIPGVKLRLTKARPSRKEGVEAEIRKDLTALARNHAVSDVIIVSAEEDLAPVIAEVQDLGIRTVLLHVAIDGDWAISRTLRQECDDLIEIGSGHLRPYVDLISGAEPQLPAASFRELAGTAAQSSGPHPAIEAPAFRLYGSQPTAEYEAGALANAGAGQGQGQGQRQDAPQFGGPGEAFNSGPIGGNGISQPQPQLSRGQHMQGTGLSQDQPLMAPAEAASARMTQTAQGPLAQGLAAVGQSPQGQSLQGQSQQAQPGHAQPAHAQPSHAQAPGAESSVAPFVVGQHARGQSAEAHQYQHPDEGRGQLSSLGQPGLDAANGSGQNGLVHSQQGQNGQAHGQQSHSQHAQNQFAQNQLGQAQFGQSQLAQDQLAQNQLAQNQLAQNQPGQSQPGQSQLGQHQPGQHQFGQTQPGQSQLAQHQAGQNQFGQPLPGHNGQAGAPGLESQGTGGQQAGGFGSLGAGHQGGTGPQPVGQSGNGLPPGTMSGNGMPANGVPGNGVPANGVQANGLPSAREGRAGGQGSGLQAGGFLPPTGLPPTGLPASGLPTGGLPANGMSSSHDGMAGRAPLGGGAQSAGAGIGGTGRGASNQGGAGQTESGPGHSLPGSAANGGPYLQGGQPAAGLLMQSGQQGPPQPGQQHQGPGLGQPGYHPPMGQAGLSQAGAGVQLRSGSQAGPATPPNGMTPLDGQRPPSHQRQLPSGNGMPYAQDRSMPYGGSLQPAQFTPSAGAAGYGPNSYGGQQQAMAPVAMPVGDAVQSAHVEGFGFGEAVARDAPALWLEAVLARKPRMPSDLEARLLQGSALPIDALLHDEVRHALRRGFWDALERSRH